jgi:Na+/H+-dicarboxylate symporter
MKVLILFHFILRTTPIGVASLIAVALLGTGNLSAAIKSLGMFSLTVVTGLLVYQLLVVPLYFFLITRTNPYSFLLTLGRPWMVAFAAASS